MGFNSGFKGLISLANGTCLSHNYLSHNYLSHNSHLFWFRLYQALIADNRKIMYVCITITSTHSVINVPLSTQITDFRGANACGNENTSVLRKKRMLTTNSVYLHAD